MPNPWLILALGLAWISSVVAVGYWQRQDGALAATNACQAAQVKSITAANTKIRELNDAARERESQYAAQMDAIGKWLAEENRNAEIRQRRAVDNARALVLRQQPACVGAGGSEVGPPVPAASGGNAQAACELPAKTVRDLFRLVGDADSGMRALDGCQQVVERDRAGQ